MLRFFSGLRVTLRSAMRRKRVEKELEAELQYHLDQLTQEGLNSGLTHDEARYAALRAMGAIDKSREECRDVRGARWLDDFLQDCRYAFRGLRRNPVFAIIAILSLALGIGANTAIFSLMDAVMWRLLPVKEPASLLLVGRQQGSNLSSGFTYSEYRILRDNNAVADLAGYTTAPLNASVDGRLEPPLQAQLVTGGYFPLLGVVPVIGRSIGTEDDKVPNGHPVAMLSYGYWQTRFGRDRSVIGRTIHLSGMPFTIIGVTPPEFFGVEVGIAPDMFLPIMMQPTIMPAFENLLEKPIVSRTWVQTVARLKPGVETAQAEAVLSTLLQRETRPGRKQENPQRVVVNPASSFSELRRQFSRPLFVLMAIVGVVLLIACANTANLLMARAAVRRPELALRLALGAGRGRLLRQLLVESLMLAAFGGICGVVLARWSVRLLVVYMSSGRSPIALDLSPSLRVLAFTATISIATGIMFGLVPALRAARLDLTPALEATGSRLTRSRRGMRPGKLLAVAQVSLSLLLLVAAGLFVRSLQKLSGDDAGVPREAVLIIGVEPRGSDQRIVAGTSVRLDGVYRGLVEHVRQLPGVRAVSMAQATPIGARNTAGALAKVASGESVRVPMLMVYPDYFNTMGIPLAAGRDFDISDLKEDSPAVCIVNEAFVREVLSTQSPLGQPCLRMRRPNVADTLSRPDAPSEPYTIVGVVKDSRYTNPKGEIKPVIYTTFLQTSTGRGQMSLHVRVSGNAGNLIPRIREEVWKLDPTLPMLDVHTLEEEMNGALVQQRLLAMLSTVFGGLALLLASVGLYGLFAFAVAQRAREMGVRIALGARRSSVIWMVLREAMVLVAIGVGIGIPAALAVARLVSSQIAGLLFGLEATDPSTIAIATATLTVVAALAAYLPARRASLVDPIVTLRSE